MNLPQRIYDFFVANLGLFAATFGKAGAIAFVGEGIVHLLVVTTSFRLVDLPFWADWGMLLLGGYCAIFLWLFRTAMVPRCGDPEVRVITSVFVTVTVLLHLYMILAGSHAILEAFGRGFSWIGVVYSVFFVLRLWTLDTRITPVRRARTMAGATAA